jgi:hypothetical protein
MEASMHPLIRSALVLLAGVVAAVLVVGLTDTLVAGVYPPPDGTDPKDKESMRRAIAAMPTMAFVLLVAGWAVAAAAGSYVAARLATRLPVAHGMIVALFVMVATVANLAAFPHPAWMWPAAIILIPAAGWLATRFRRPRLLPEAERVDVRP